MQTPLLSVDSTVVQRKGNVVSDMDGSKVMLSIEQGKYYNLGNIGGDIWDLMESEITISDVINQLLAWYDVEEEECYEHVFSFLTQLLNEDLIILVD